MLPNGNAALLLFDNQPVDMSAVVPGGCPNAIVRGAILQELDPSHNVVFEWRSWDHVAITEALHEDLTSCFIDYVHPNSIEYDADGDILMSCRNTDTLLKIDRQTGDVLWRMGGALNDFTLAGDTRWFTYQHSARITPAGTITVFDNGSFSSPQVSRAVEYSVDEVDKIATRIWDFHHDPEIYAHSNGSVQRLPNGNTLISWGTSGIVTEVRPDGSTAFEMDFVAEANRTYAAYRHPWEGVAAAPTLWADVVGALVTLHFTKFGDTSVERFNVYRGSSPAPVVRVGSTPRSSFTLRDVDPGETVYVRVTSEDGTAIESPFSNELEITVPHPLGVDRTSTVRASHGPFLYPNHPNPFVRSTAISFVLPERGAVELSIYDVRGRLVRSVTRGTSDAGLHAVVWDGRDERGGLAGSGVYFYRLRVGERSLTRVMTLLR
jgi:hypothetical protein